MERNSVRAFLAHETSDIHQALHHHPLLSKLTSSALTHREYENCLIAQRSTFLAIETARTAHGVYPHFALTTQLNALNRDMKGFRRLDNVDAPLALPSEHDVLGALYIAHGSQFGRGMIRKKLAQHLPGLKMEYFEMPAQPALWRDLLSTLEASETSDMPALLRGAKAGFALMHAAADAAHEKAVRAVKSDLATTR